MEIRFQNVSPNWRLIGRTEDLETYFCSNVGISSGKVNVRGIEQVVAGWGVALEL